LAYSDYGSFVYENGKRRPDKEDVRVFDTDSGARIFLNILKNQENGTNEWWNHSHHGVMGDGNVRVACYKQGWPEIYIWEDGNDKPTCYRSEEIIKMFSWQNESFVESYNSGDEFYIDFEYPSISFEIDGYKFKFTSSDYSDHYEAEMIEPNGTEWLCVYDYGYGAGLTDID